MQAKPCSSHLPLAYRLAALILFLVLILYLVQPVYADIAPPDTPPGANPLPGSETTQVRMVSETVTMDVLKLPAGVTEGQAKVTGVFNMRNLGSQAETMTVRFPLTFFDGASDGFFEYPEIRDLQVKVNGAAVLAHRVMMPPAGSRARADAEPIPWSAFDVTFPPGEDVQVIVTYTGGGMGEDPFVIFKYVLETGAGWNDTIGSADIIVRLPYEASRQNVIFDESVGFGVTTPGAELSGNEVRWHFDDLEPDRDSNIEVALVKPQAWMKVLSEQENLRKAPRDGEAWGRLGKAYKEAIMLRRGLRADPGGREMYNLALEAYQKSLEILPNDSLWHAGYADLLWNHYYWGVSFTDRGNFDELITVINELKTALEINPRNQVALDLLQEIGWSVENVVRESDGGYDYLILTATPVITPWYTPTPPATPTSPATPTRADTKLPALSATDTPVLATDEVTPASEPQPTNTNAPESRPAIPFCGGAALLVPAVAGASWLRRRF